MTTQRPPQNVLDAVMDHAQQGTDPSGNRRPVAVTALGDVYGASRTVKTQIVKVPGIGTGSAYASADAFGTSFSVPVPVTGTITTVVFLDYDDEGITKEIVLFDASFTETADNSAFAVSDADLRKLVGVVNIDTFYNFGSNQAAVVMPALYYDTQGKVAGTLFGQFVTRGADNIAAGSIPEFFFVIVE